MELVSFKLEPSIGTPVSLGIINPLSVLLTAATYGFVKLIDYGLLFWLPAYLQEIVGFKTVVF